jgi:peptidoglycan/LPS O-acetylase OafA/YrhL
MSSATPKEPAKPQGHVLLSIQALRGLAVMAVVVIHIQLYFSNKLRMPDFLPQFNIGAASVDVFFVISGFIMVYASERLFGQPGGMRIYFLRRIARIVPMYWAATTILLVYVLVRYDNFGAVAGGAQADYVIASYLFYPYVRPDGWGAPLLGVGWTLNYEVFFYTLFGFLILLSRRTVVAIIAAIFCALIALRMAVPGIPNPFAYWFNPLIIEFVFGMGIAVAYREGIRLPMWLVYALVAAGLAVLGWSWSQAHFFDPPSWLRVPVWGLPALAIVGGFALAERRVPHNLFWRVSGFLGDASYSIYLVHTLTLGVPVLLFGRWLAPADAPWFYLACMLIVTTIPSFLVYLYAEKPLIDYFARKIEGPRAPLQAAAVATPATAP